MSVEVNKGGLVFAPEIDTSSLEDGRAKVRKVLNEIRKESEADNQKMLQDVRNNTAKNQQAFQSKIREISLQSRGVIQDSLQSFNQLDGVYKRLFTNIQLHSAQLNKLKIAERELNQARKEGHITQGEYNKQVAALRQEANRSTLELKKLFAEVKKANEPIKVEGLSKESISTLEKAAKTLEGFSPEVQKSIKELVNLENQFEDLRKAESDLERQFAKGTITQKQYSQGMEGIRSGMLKTKNEINNVSQIIRANRSQLGGTGLKQGWDGLGNSLSQISREIPAFTYSIQTGFLAISNNIPILADEIARLRVQNEALKASGQKTVPVWKQVVKGLLSWQTLLPIGIALITVYGKEIGQFFKELFTGKKAFDSIRESQELLNNAFEQSSYKKAIQDVEALKSQIELANKGMVAAGSVVDLYNESLGKVTGEVNNLKEAEEGLIANGEKYIQSQYLKAAATLALEQAAQKAVEAAQKRLELENELKETGEQLQKALAGPRRISGTGATSNVSNLEQKIKSIGFQLNKLKNQSEDEINSLNGIFRNFEAEAAKLNINLLGNNDPKVSKEIIDSRKGLLEKIADLDREYAKIEMDDNKAEVKSLKEKFQKVRSLVSQFNSDPKNSKVVIDVKGLDDIEKKALDNLKFKQDTEALKDHLTAQKALYTEYETFISEYGVEAANERFKNQIDTSRKFIEILQEEYNKLAKIQPKDRNNLQNERLDFISKFLEYEKKSEEAEYDQLIKSLRGYEEERKAVIESYRQDERLLLEKGKSDKIAILQGQRDDELRVLDEEYARKTIKLKEFFEVLSRLTQKEGKERIDTIKTKLGELLSNDELKLDSSFIDSVFKQLDKAEEQLNMRIPIALSSIGREFKNIAGVIGDANQGLGLMFSTLGDILSFSADIKANIDGINAGKSIGGPEGFITSATSALGVVGAVFGAIGTVANLFDQAAKRQLETTRAILDMKYQEYDAELEIQRIYRENALQKAKENKNTLASLDAQKATLLESLKEVKESQSEIYGGITGNLSNSEAKDLRKINERYSLGINKYNKLLQELESQVYVTGTREVKKSGISGLFGGTEIVNTYGSLSGKSFEELFILLKEDKLVGRAKELVEEMIRLKEEGEEIEGQLQDIEQAYKNILTGGATADGIADSIIQGFQQGKRAAQDFGDNIEEILRNAILSSFKYQHLEGPINELLDQFYEYAQDGLTPEEIKKIQDTYAGIINTGIALYDDLEKATGINLGNLSGDSNTSAGISGGIQRTITEETATELAGLFRGFYDVSKRTQIGIYDHLAVANQQLNVLNQISTNTGDTVTEVRAAVVELKQIVKNTKSGSDRDLGVDP